MATTPSLAILVPTYCRADDVEHLLRRLAAEPRVRDGDVPIVVSDNASTDATPDTLRRLQAELAGVDLRVHRQTENLGAVRNVAWLVHNAPEADYAWVIGDDDVPVAGAVQTVLEILAEHPLELLHLPHGWRMPNGVCSSPCPEAL